MYVISENASSERRITPSWSIDTFKTKLEPITGIPPSAQRLSLKSSKAAQSVPLEAADEENTFLNSFPLAAYGEIHVSLFIISFSGFGGAFFFVSSWVPWSRLVGMDDGHHLGILDKATVLHKNNQNDMLTAKTGSRYPSRGHARQLQRHLGR